MMKIRMRVNLGRGDAEQHGLDLLQAGAEVDVSDAAGKWLVEHGHAELLGVAKHAAVEGVPPKRGSVEKATEDLKEYRKRAKGEDE
jgi:hypothetical protein